MLSKYEEVCCAVVDCGIGVVVEVFPSGDEDDVSVVFGDGLGFVVACKVVGVNEDDSRSFPGSVSVVDAMSDDAVVVVTDEDPQVGREMLEAPVTALQST